MLLRQIFIPEVSIERGKFPLQDYIYNSKKFFLHYRHGFHTCIAGHKLIASIVDLLVHYIMHVLYVYKSKPVGFASAHIFLFSLETPDFFLFVHIEPFQTYTHCNLDSLCSPNSKFM